MSEQPVLTEESKKVLTEARKEACRLGIAVSSKEHILLALLNDYCISRVFEAELGEDLSTLIHSIAELATRREKPVKKSYRGFGWYDSIRGAKSEDRFYRTGKIYPEHFLLAFLTDDRVGVFLRTYLDSCGVGVLLHKVRGGLEKSLRERVSS